MIKKVYEIMVDGKETGRFYIADSKEEAVKKHIKRCVELYFITCARKPSMKLFYGIDAREVMRVHE